MTHDSEKINFAKVENRYKFLFYFFFQAMAQKRQSNAEFSGAS